MSSNWKEALEALRCPHCGAHDIPNAKPTLEREQDGSRTCANCSTNFRPKGQP